MRPSVAALLLFGLVVPLGGVAGGARSAPAPAQADAQRLVVFETFNQPG